VRIACGPVAGLQVWVNVHVYERSGLGLTRRRFQCLGVAIYQELSLDAWIVGHMYVVQSDAPERRAIGPTLEPTGGWQSGGSWVRVPSPPPIGGWERGGRARSGAGTGDTRHAGDRSQPCHAQGSRSRGRGRGRAGDAGEPAGGGARVPPEWHQTPAHTCGEALERGRGSEVAGDGTGGAEHGWDQAVRVGSVRCVAGRGEGGQSVWFGPEADGFEELLGRLAGRSAAVDLVLGSGERVGAVLVAVAPGVVTYERWEPGAAQPSGVPETVAVGEIAEVRVW